MRSLQDLLQELGCDLATLAPRLNDNDTETQTEVLWQSLVALSQHLLISDLAATAGIWLQLHQSHEMARQLGLVDRVPKNEVKSLQEIYYSAILLGCAQPASLSSAEVVFVAINVGQFAKQIELINDSEADTPAAFWIDPAKDSPAVACTRKPAPPETPVHFFFLRTDCGNFKTTTLRGRKRASDSGTERRCICPYQRRTWSNAPTYCQLGRTWKKTFYSPATKRPRKSLRWA